MSNIKQYINYFKELIERDNELSESEIENMDRTMAEFIAGLSDDERDITISTFSEYEDLS